MSDLVLMSCPSVPTKSQVAMPCSYHCYNAQVVGMYKSLAFLEYCFTECQSCIIFHFCLVRVFTMLVQENKTPTRMQYETVPRTSMLLVRL